MDWRYLRQLKNKVEASNEENENNQMEVTILLDDLMKIKKENATLVFVPEYTSGKIIMRAFQFES